jgi:NAD(P)H-hydrate epimerase
MSKAFSSSSVPDLTTEQMVEVDRAMIEDYRIELIQMMENAGRNLAHLTRTRFLDGDPRGRPVVALAGGGGNGGGALVAARRLSNWGANVTVVLGQAPSKMTPVPGHQLDILRRMGLRIVADGMPPAAPPPAIVLDGLIGYSLAGAPFGRIAELIRWANLLDAPILALDAPSGLDATTGVVFDPTIRATATMTLALPKQGLRGADVSALVGELYLADISVPPWLYGRSPISLPLEPIFALDDIVRIG